MQNAFLNMLSVCLGNMFAKSFLMLKYLLEIYRFINFTHTHEVHKIRVV